MNLENYNADHAPVVDKLADDALKVIVTPVEFLPTIDYLRIYRFAVIWKAFANERVEWIIADGIAEADRLHAALVCDLLIAAIPRPLKLFIAYDTEKALRWAAKTWPSKNIRTALKDYLEERAGETQ
ncbi:hypothetical protein [Phyllobacterium lublinensis]|uniref:hypothetical protein n=1 Tax=Phyllobacterium lublinensis TaxID=2875708 RepID=UPI001CCD3062|nr:hypothetical protein [Phyllobacterium sp. 2063]MBZ9654677.1 hypothetical protein [Phyllobacterium sp. 2063]